MNSKFFKSLALAATMLAASGISAMADDTYTVKMADGTADAEQWTISPNPATAGQTVTLKYNGTKKVKSITAKIIEGNGGGGSTGEVTVDLSTALTMEAITDGTIVVQSPQSGMQYTLNGGEKKAVTADAIEVVAGDKVAFYGNGTNITYYSGTKIAGGTAQVKVYGNIMSLMDETGYETATELSSGFAFYGLFWGNATLTDASSLLLPVTTLTYYYCYSSMFQDCTSLTAAPALPATTMVRECYTDMFKNCTSLTTAPALPATTMADNCYSYMFMGCTSLTTAPVLPATTLAKECYKGMFSECTSLTTAPALPATTLAQSCYSAMFSECTGLTEAPVLPATTLVNFCYSYMFRNCTSLTTAPVLPATTLPKQCYYNMFIGCSNLASVTCLATSGINQTLSTYCWLQNAGTDVTGTKTVYTASGATWPTNSDDGIPTGWTRVNYQP